MKSVDFTNEKYSMKIYKSSDLSIELRNEVFGPELRRIDKLSCDYCIILNIKKIEEIHAEFGDIYVAYWKKPEHYLHWFLDIDHEVKSMFEELALTRIGNSLWMEIGEHIIELLNN